MSSPGSLRPLITACTLLGIGMGGFFDGILLHQLLQTHNMLSAKLPKTTVQNMEVNMFWDGLFHSFTWLCVAAGLAMLWRLSRRGHTGWPGRAFLGAMFLGWGLFNLIEGIVDHHLLNIHHVVERLGVSAFDYAFLGSGVVFIAGGWLAIRSARDERHSKRSGRA